MSNDLCTKTYRKKITYYQRQLMLEHNAINRETYVEVLRELEAKLKTADLLEFEMESGFYPHPNL